jgi:hypothetical protein
LLAQRHVKRFAFCLMAACGNDVGVQPDASGPPGSPIVMVTSPRTGDAFYPTETVRVEWTATDEDASVSCDVTTTGSSPITIASKVAAMSGKQTSVSWSLSGVTAAAYQVRVACADANKLVGNGVSPMFVVSGLPQNVSFASQIQPLLTASCTSMACHDAIQPQQGLDLVTGHAYAQLVSVASTECSTSMLVKPGAPSDSYLVVKLAGGGTCSTGSRMPKAATAWSSDQIQLVRDWIANGAPNN